MQLLARHGVHKSKIFGVQIQSVGLAAIERVAAYRGVQTVMMRAMNAQLMGSAGKGLQRNPCLTILHLINMIIGNGPTTMLIVYFLSWTIEQIGAQGQRNGALTGGNGAAQYGGITLAYGVSCKLTLPGCGAPLGS